MIRVNGGAERVVWGAKVLKSSGGVFLGTLLRLYVGLARRAYRHLRKAHTLPITYHTSQQTPLFSNPGMPLVHVAARSWFPEDKAAKHARNTRDEFRNYCYVTPGKEPPALRDNATDIFC